MKKTIEFSNGSSFEISDDPKNVIRCDDNMQNIFTEYYDLTYLDVPWLCIQDPFSPDTKKDTHS